MSGHPAGRKMLDFVLGYGAVIIGHADPRVDDQVINAIRAGVCRGLNTPLELELVQELVRIAGYAESGSAILLRTGSDATGAAVRLARAATGRDAVIRVGYNGWHDWCAPRKAGVPPEVSRLTSEVAFNNAPALSREIAIRGRDLACVIMVPTDAHPPQDGYLEEARRATHAAGAIFILDEVRTGFRLALGGAQEYFGIDADMVTYSKALANGFPVSAVVGRAEIMEAVGVVSMSSLYFRGADGPAAALATLGLLGSTDTLQRIWDTGAMLQTGLSGITRSLGVPARQIGMPVMPFHEFDTGDLGRDRWAAVSFARYAVERGVLFHPAHHWFICGAMTQFACRVRFGGSAARLSACHGDGVPGAHMMVLGISGFFNVARAPIYESVSPHFYHDAAAALVIDGQVVAAAEQERFDRIKHSNNFPLDAIAACLEVAGVQYSDIDYIAFFFEEEHTDQDLLALHVREPVNEFRFARELIMAALEARFGSRLEDERLLFVRHHEAHAACAFFDRVSASDALVCVVDGAGEKESISLFQGTQGGLALISGYDRQLSLGHFYGFMTDYLGFGDFSEYKVMGLAAYGDARRLKPWARKGYELLPAGAFFIHPEEIARNLARAGVRPRRPGTPVTASDMDAAAVVQEIVNDVLVHVLKYAQKQTGARALCLGGGVAQNSSANGVIARSGIFDEMYVHYAPHDSGTSLGAALLVARQKSAKPSRTGSGGRVRPPVAVTPVPGCSGGRAQRDQGSPSGMGRCCRVRSARRYGAAAGRAHRARLPGCRSARACRVRPAGAGEPEYCRGPETCGEP